MVVEPHSGGGRRREGGSGWLTFVPLLLLSVILYAGLALVGVDFGATLFEVPLPSGGRWAFTATDAVMVFTLFLLFIEILKSTKTGGNSVFDHAMSLLVFILCLILFLVWDLAATSLFFLITMVTLIDVVAGFSVTIRAARRDYAFGGDM
ncbi:hypothetical protein A7A08_02891 [Methyloligella halotolerans]|uniref:Uncharacterized protein n=1 Tax=Methyloligella halotolerans TaxID=1177755 RepID=A0A1E2RVI3_9HYPH|nr:hypothetical protein [Methyloligella halotolerans]ODA66244.1 hypothetical protein A7A08_02891 [Methyloligella halotolerans]